MVQTQVAPIGDHILANRLGAHSIDFYYPQLYDL